MQSGHNYIKSLGFKINRMKYRMWTFNHGIHVFNQNLNKHIFIETGDGPFYRVYHTYEVELKLDNDKIILVDTMNTCNFSTKIYSEIYGEKLVYDPKEFLLLRTEIRDNETVFHGL